MNKTVLLYCPLCKSDDVIHKPAGGYHKIQCRGCGFETCGYATLTRAAEIWNSRGEIWQKTDIATLKKMIFSLDPNTLGFLLARSGNSLFLQNGVWLLIVGNGIAIAPVNNINKWVILWAPKMSLDGWELSVLAEKNWKKFADLYEEAQCRTSLK